MDNYKTVHNYEIMEIFSLTSLNVSLILEMFVFHYDYL